MSKLGFFLVALLGGVVPAYSARPDKPVADGFFGSEKVYALHLHVTEEDWELMQPTRRPRPAPLVADSIAAPDAQAAHEAQAAAPSDPPYEKKSPAIDGEKLPPNNFGFEYVYVKAAFECDGQKLSDVAIRFKGNSSYENYRQSLKRPIKIDFNRFVSGQKFHGLQTLNLGNNAFDPSQLREALSYEVYRRAGVPAPRTAFANVYLTIDGRYDRQYVGLYTLIEEMDDKAFLKSHFKNAGGVVVKPEGIRGLPYMGENWNAYAQRYHPKTSENNPAFSKRFIEFIKLVNYADDATFNARIGEYLNIDDFLRYLAATVLIANLDSPLVTNHNFYFYQNPADQKAWLLPWDMNLSFAGYGTPGPRDEQINLSIAHPWGGESKIFQRVLAIKENEALYRKYLREFVDKFYNRSTMLGLIDAMEAAIIKADPTARRKGFDETGGSAFGRSRYSLSDFIPKRIESVVAQLDGKDVPEFIPRAAALNANFPWGINASPQFGRLPSMGQAIRKSADIDRDYYLSSRELRDGSAALFYTLVNEEHPESMSETELAAGLTPLLRDYAPQSTRGFFGFNRGAGNAGTLWAQAIFRAADSNGDGRLNLDEFTTLADRMACLADRDQDDKLDEREIIEALDHIADPDGPAAGAENNRRSNLNSAPPAQGRPARRNGVRGVR
jgi:spore coat protein CotH